MTPLFGGRDGRSRRRFGEDAGPTTDECLSVEDFRIAQRDRRPPKFAQRGDELRRSVDPTNGIRSIEIRLARRT